MHVIKKRGIQSVLRNPEQEKTLGRII